MQNGLEATISIAWNCRAIETSCDAASFAKRWCNYLYGLLKHTQNLTFIQSREVVVEGQTGLLGGEPDTCWDEGFNFLSFNFTVPSEGVVCLEVRRPPLHNSGRPVPNHVEHDLHSIPDRLCHHQQQGRSIPGVGTGCSSGEIFQDNPGELIKWQPPQLKKLHRRYTKKTCPAISTPRPGTALFNTPPGFHPSFSRSPSGK